MASMCSNGFSIRLNDDYALPRRSRTGEPSATPAALAIGLRMRRARLLPHALI